jgi:hypothetical protein
MISIDLATKGSTGTGLKSAQNLEFATVMAVEFQVEAVGGTPTVTYTVKGCPPGKDPNTAGNYVALAYVTENAGTASSSAAFTTTAVGRNVVFIDGLDRRFFIAIAVDVTANTNVTYSARVHIPTAL